MTVVADKPKDLCSGRNCTNPSIGMFNELHRVPEWRKPTEYSERACAYELGAVVHYCADHKQAANDYTK
jgi:hypothetical protein